eukprot:1573416-Rhodomonas_salina.2
MCAVAEEEGGRSRGRSAQRHPLFTPPCSLPSSRPLRTHTFHPPPPPPKLRAAQHRSARAAFPSHAPSPSPSPSLAPSLSSAEPTLRFH